MMITRIYSACAQQSASRPSVECTCLRSLVVRVRWLQFRGVEELGSSSTILLLIPSWTEIVQRRMTTAPIVKDFDVFKNGLLRLLQRVVRMPIGPFPFERPNETLHSRIVVAIALATHAHLDAGLSQEQLIASTAVLTATV